MSRTLVVGFESNILEKIRCKFDVSFSIAEDKSADLNWHEFHQLRADHKLPDIDATLMACMQEVRKHYLQFTDINSRRYYYVPGRESETYNGFILTFYTAYRILKDHQIELVLHANIPHEGFDFVLHKIACHLGIRSVLCYQSLISNRFWLMESMSGLGYFKRLPVLFPSEASNYELPRTWFYMKGSDQDAAYRFRHMLEEVARKPLRLIPAMVRYLYASQFRRHVRELTQSPVSGESYIYFPLHLQPELTTSALGGLYADQMLALEALSAKLPDGYKIYVKENPKQTEKQRGPHFYKRLAALSNVRLLSRTENSVALIQGSAGVATITGTAGWEALFYGKPVLVFGAAWYREFPGVTEYSGDFDFGRFVKATIPTSHDLIAVLEAALCKAGRGVVDPAYAALVAGFDVQQNATDVADSLWRFACELQMIPQEARS